jgi:hypothetical protein
MVKALQVAQDTPFLGSRASEPIDLGRDEVRKSRLFGWVRYRVIGRLAATLDYALIVLASIVAGVVYHSAILQGDVPDLMPYVAAGNIVAALFVFGAASRGNYSPIAIVSTRRQLRSVVIFWSLSFLSLALFLFLAKSGPDFSRGTIVIFGVLGFVLLLGSNLWISASLKRALARGTLAGDRAITIGDRDAMMSLSHESLLQKAGAREIKRYLLPPLTELSYADGARVVDEAIQYTRSNSVDCVLLALQWNDQHRRDMI